MGQKIQIGAYFIIYSVCLCPQINAQAFQGELVYQYHVEVNDLELLDRMSSVGLPNPNDTNSDTRQTLMVNGHILASKSFGNDGNLRYKQLLDETQAIIQFPSGRTVDYYSASFTNPGKPSLLLEGKVEDYKEINGYNCQKYVYLDENNKKVIAWIAKNIEIDPMVSTLPFFNTFFLAEGLALELILENTSGHSHWTLITIEERNISKEEIMRWFNKQS